MAAKRTRINCCPTPAPRAVFIYMIDPLSYCVDNMELAMLFSMDKIWCFSDMLCG